jgi:hypothetical protein
MVSRKEMVAERNARLEAKQRENEIQGMVFSHIDMRKEMRRQELVKEFMLALAPRFDHDDNDSSESIHSAALDLATVYMVRSKEWLDEVEGDIRYELTGK